MRIEELNTPCYVADYERFRNNVNDLLSAYRLHYGNFNVGYSYKTSYHDKFLQIAKECGLYAEVVSPKEYKMANALGYADADIVYNGVIPDAQHKAQVARHGGIVNVENLQELKELVLEWGVREIGVRVAFDVGNDLESRFGFFVDSQEYKEMVGFLSENHVKVKCLHCHISEARDLYSFRRRIMMMTRLAKNFGADIVDIGGNMYGRMHDEAFRRQFLNYCTFEQYGEIVGELMKEAFPDESVKLIAEAGTPLVSDAVSLALTILTVKEINGKKYIIVDGKTSDAGFVSKYKIPPCRHYGRKANEVKYAMLVACTCIEEDVIRLYSGPANVGDKIVIDNVGAYSANLVTDFIVDGCRMFHDAKDIEYGER